MRLGVAEREHMEYSDHSPSPKLWNKIHQKISVLLWIQGSLWNVIWKMHCWVFQMFQQWRREEKKKTLKNSTVLHKNLGIQIWYGNSSKPAVLLGDLAPQIKLPMDAQTIRNIHGIRTWSPSTSGSVHICCVRLLHLGQVDIFLMNKKSRNQC